MRMLILVTGISIPDPIPTRTSRRQQGFTLWEILIVVAIVVITVSAMVSSTSLGRSDANFKLLGNDLGRLIYLLSLEAVFENRHYAVSYHQQGYHILEYNGEDWLISEQSFFRRIKLGENRQSSLMIDNVEVVAAEVDRAIPHILILSSGEMTPFSWEITDTDLNAQIIVQGDPLGKVTVLGPVYLSDS